MFGTKRLSLDDASGLLGNPSSPHAEGRLAAARLDAARGRIAELCEVQADDVVFTSGATEANNMAIQGILRGKKGHALYLPSSHASIVETYAAMAHEGIHIEPLPIKDARVDIDVLRTMLRPDTLLVSMDAVCGETGVVWNAHEVGQLLRSANPVLASLGHGPQSAAGGIPAAQPVRALLHIDASQAPLTEKLTRSHFGADLLVFDGAKIAPVRGVGCLIAHRTLPLAPLTYGGGQERGLRPGTENPEGAEAFAAALAAAARGRAAFVATAQAARARFAAFISSSLEEVYINEGRLQAPNILNLSLPGRDTDYIVALLDEAGCAVATRSACETDSEEGSRAVFALTGDRERAKATLRISWARTPSEREIARFCEALASAIRFVDNATPG